MSEPVVVVEEKPLTPSELFTKIRTEKAAAAPPAKPAEAKPADAAAAAVPEKRASGDERKFRSLLSRRDREIGELRAKVDALTPKQAATAATHVATAGAAPKREDFATDEEFTEARTAHQVAKAVEKQRSEDAQTQKVKETLDAYNALIAAGPAKYEDWDETLKAGSGAALSVDLGKECPSLFWAIASSPHADDVFYSWLKDSTKLQALIDLYKSGPQGEIDALTAFHRFEGRVAKDAPAKVAAKEPGKADDAVKVPKPRPSAEAQVRGGAAAPSGAPEMMLPGTNTISPAWKAWKYQQQGRN